MVPTTSKVKLYAKVLREIALRFSFPSPPLWATYIHLTVIDAKEVGNISDLAGCDGEFN